MPTFQDRQLEARLVSMAGIEEMIARLRVEVDKWGEAGTSRDLPQAASAETSRKPLRGVQKGAAVNMQQTAEERADLQSTRYDKRFTLIPRTFGNWMQALLGKNCRNSAQLCFVIWMAFGRHTGYMEDQPLVQI